MSWSYRVEPVAVKDLENSFLDAKPSGQDFPEVFEQLTAAKEAFLAIVKSGAIGKLEPDAIVSGYLGGHANPGHAKTPGWANDGVTVNVYVAELPAPTA